MNGAAVLRNVPVPPSPAPRATLTPAQWVLGYSLLVDTVLRHQGWQYEWALDHERAIPRGDGERLACLLLKRVATLGLPTLVVAEYDPWLWQNADNAREQRLVTGLVLKCAADAGLQGADAFLPDLAADTLLADKAFDADARVIDLLTANNKVAVIPSKSNRKVQRQYDKELYKARDLIENFFCKLKQFRAIATRYDKLARNFLAGVLLAASYICLN